MYTHTLLCAQVLRRLPELDGRPADVPRDHVPPGAVRSVFKTSCLFLRPRPWQFEI